ncbi:MAG: M14-type cytosolic carboxypeptidase [Candidatus Dactylopiibacterium sp.]|nr:M14-type cytosolic carboxypeptidase [Candidatus Dactylopiibacterium sp.]
MPITVNCQFDSGNIEVLDASQPSDIRLAIRPDAGGEFLQWFHFSLAGVRGQPVRFVIANAGQTSYAQGWEGYRCVASYDRAEWFRLPGTSYDGERLSVEFTPERDVVWLAYFEPYSQERRLDFLGRCSASPWVRAESLGTSLQGRSIDVLHVGEGPRQVWVQARQHPGETMAEWFMEGFITRLLDRADPVARVLRGLASFHLIPNINPDGSVLGHLRTNAAGVNLNREWHAPTPARSPEVLHAQRAMLATGADLFLDIHGDETLPYVFIDGSHMVPGYGERNLALQADFLAALTRASPDFQTVHGYADDRFTDEMQTLASKWAAMRLGCVSLTLEMPFKDNANAPDAFAGWSSARSQRLGAAFLDAVLAHLKAL